MVMSSTIAHSDVSAHNIFDTISPLMKPMPDPKHVANNTTCSCSIELAGIRPSYYDGESSEPLIIVGQQNSGLTVLTQMRHNYMYHATQVNVFINQV